MFRPFQVNVGNYLTFHHDILPTAKVSQLCVSIEAVSGEKADGQVLLTADGRQMDPQDLIGNYSVGTEDKPLFVFYRRYLSTSDPPVVPSRMPQKGSLQRQLEILRQRPTPSLFQHQAALSKNLCGYCVEVGRLCELLSEEYSLQLRGWKTVLSNCGNLIGMFQKHHQLFCKTVEKFREEKPHNLDLLQKFPEQVKFLRKLPMPSSLSKSTTALSLYDWISTHDEKNSLLDLSTQCNKALSKVNSEQLERALQSSQEIKMMSDEVLEYESGNLEAVGERIKTGCLELKKIMETVVGLNKNIQTTSDKALRSGDAKTIAVLVESHHKSLQLMASSSSQLEAIMQGAEEARRELTTHIHGKLKRVMELQKRVAECNGQLVLLHEHMKLAHKRFEILEQVCSTPEVMVEVCGEVARRRAYNTALEKVMEDTISRLHRARQEEKRLRKSFQSSGGNHFVTTLFPELQNRVPDITFHSPKSLTKTHDDNLDEICSLLPQDVRASTQLATSLLLLTEPTPNHARDNTITSAVHLKVTPDASPAPGDSWRLVEKEESPYPSITTTTSPLSGGEGEARDGSLEDLKELVGKLELSKIALTSKLKKNQQKKEALQAALVEKESSYLDVVQKLSESEKLVSALQQRVSDLPASGEPCVSEEVSAAVLVKGLEPRTSDLADKLARTSRELQDCRGQCDQLTGEREKATADIGALSDRLRTLQQDHAAAMGKLEEEGARMRDELRGAGELRDREVQSLQDRLSESESGKQQAMAACEALRVKGSALEAQLCELQASQEAQKQEMSQSELEKQHALSACEELKVKEAALETQLSALQTSWKVQRQELQSKLELEKQELVASTKEELQMKEDARLSELQEGWEVERQSLVNELAKCRAEQEVERETLSKNSAVSNELGTVREELRGREKALESCAGELDLLKKEREEELKKLEMAKMECGKAKEEVRAVREQLREKEEACRVDLDLVKKQHEKEVRAIEEELTRQQQRSQQAQSTMNSNRAQLEALDAKRKTLNKELGEKEAEKKQLLADLEQVKKLLSSKDSEVIALKAMHAVELSDWETKVFTESDRAGIAEKKKQELENSLNQKQPRLKDLEEKLTSAKARIQELEADASCKKEKLLSADGRFQQLEQELRSCRSQLQEKQREKDRQKDELEHKAQEMLAKLEKTVRDHEQRTAEWGVEREHYSKQVKELEDGRENWIAERDGYIKEVMELEREVKELKRDAGHPSPPSGTSSPSKQVIHRMASSGSGSLESSSQAVANPDVLSKVVIHLHSFQVGQIGLFVSDQYGNYLALSIDGKTYYLDAESVRNLPDLGLRMPQLKLKWKILVGKVTTRLYMEVRKENNRLKVPVGSRLYKLQAEHVAI